MNSASSKSWQTLNQSYKRAAEIALKLIGRPATVTEIVELIRQDETLTKIIGGRTPHKTIQARIATDIRRYGSGSKFYRYAPATFGLRELAEQGSYDRGYRKIYIGRDRRREIDPTPVLCLKKEDLKLHLHNKLLPSEIVPMRYWRGLNKHFVRNTRTNKRDFLEIKLFIVLRHKDLVICYSPTEFDQKNTGVSNYMSIGINGSIHEIDVDLFDKTGIGFDNANIREIKNFFYFIPAEIDRSVEDVSYIGVVSDQISPERSQQIGIVSQVCVNEEFMLSNTILGISNLHWCSLRYIPNSFGDLDSWSQYTFRMLHERLLSEHI
ncbi:winged helix-turn-helix domain-containing protein [Rhizobium phaseoli]|uniref:winged helix-turn-helix domain-containing protein n=1 Tax=Rhizobium phaseoli TaxID=396 RepID=UPI0016805231|nr:winged helix-turn-helix domain-containing protein [Rhizobium phaseoli]